MTLPPTPQPAVQLYTIREALREDPAAALARLADIGFGTVEPFDLVAFGRPLADAAAAAGLRAVTTHQSVIGVDLGAVGDAADAFGIRLVVQPWTDPERWTTREGVEAVADDLAAAARALADRGIAVGYHNHWFELEQRFDGRTALEVFADRLPREVVLEVDTYWAAVGGEDPAALLARLGERVVAIHVKDGAISRDATTQTAVGDGSMRVPEILAAAPGALRVVELDDCAGDRFEALARSLAYLRGLGVA